MKSPLRLSFHVEILTIGNITRSPLRLSLHVEILTIGNIRLFLRNLESPWMTALLGLSLLLVAYTLVVLLHTLIMNVLISCYMHLMILYGA
jgi:hypothetical protein